MEEQGRQSGTKSRKGRDREREAQRRRNVPKLVTLFLTFNWWHTGTILWITGAEQEEGQ